MADDIMHPLLLVPDVKKIYSISLFDKAYSSSGTWESQKQDIINVLMFGRKKCYHDKSIHGDTFAYHYLKGKSRILKDRDDKENKRWLLVFKYDGVVRELIYYYDRNFLVEWPEEIRNISNISAVGSMSVDGICDSKRKIFRKMLKERCFSGFMMCFLKFSSHDFKDYYEKITMKDGKEREGEKLACFAINEDNFSSIMEERTSPESLA